MNNQSIPKTSSKTNPLKKSETGKNLDTKGTKGKKKYLPNPFNFVYSLSPEELDLTISKKPEVLETVEYAVGLEDKIEGDFDLESLIFEFRYNQFSYIRNGLAAAKIKFLKLYKNFGDGTFVSFCQEQLYKSRWQVDDDIKGARVALELIYQGFEIIPTNTHQAMALNCFTGEELREAWNTVLEAFSDRPHKITGKSIRNLLFAPTKKDLTDAKLQIPRTLHEEVHREAAEQGWSIPQLISAMLHFFKSGGNSHLFDPKPTDNSNRKNKAKRAHRLKRIRSINVDLGLDPIPY